jgi:hypothetical protein
MEFIKKYKTSLVIFSVILLLFGGYYYWSTSSTSENAGQLTTESSSAAASSLAGREILAALRELRSLRIDSSVFESAVYKSLVDYTIATTSEPLGRLDPFAPLPFESEKKTAQ